eukprot:TRINITY_DN7500_c0_g1_i4.p1 TRINITY_DN7500_c0_g1~~TRINITY_DN7500_c0_g1_i4.p1  ORF type:complete len:228 (+),score=44.31 TRINITY_DN7500_c0_g1_i4:107-790(+)
MNVTTQNFCPLVIQSAQYTINFRTFNSNFRTQVRAYFLGDTIGIEVTVPQTSGPISRIRINYLSVVLSDNSSIPLFLPEFRPNSYSYIFVQNGVVTSSGVSAGVQPNVCNLYPTPNNNPLGCPRNTLRFRFNVPRTLFNVPADTFLPLRIGLRLDVTPGSKKEISELDTSNLSIRGGSFISVANPRAIKRNVIDDENVIGLATSGAGSFSPVLILTAIFGVLLAFVV